MVGGRRRPDRARPRRARGPAASRADRARAAGRGRPGGGRARRPPDARRSHGVRGGGAERDRVQPAHAGAADPRRAVPRVLRAGSRGQGQGAEAARPAGDLAGADRGRRRVAAEHDQLQPGRAAGVGPGHRASAAGSRRRGGGRTAQPRLASQRARLPAALLRRARPGLQAHARARRLDARGADLDADRQRAARRRHRARAAGVAARAAAALAGARAADRAGLRLPAGTGLDLGRREPRRRADRRGHDDVLAVRARFPARADGARRGRPGAGAGGLLSAAAARGRADPRLGRRRRAGC